MKTFLCILMTLKKMLESKVQELSGISKSTISRCLKSKLNMSYQKFSKIALKAWKQENIRKMLKSASLLYRLTHNNTEIIFVDEFSFQLRGLCMDGLKNPNPLWNLFLNQLAIFLLYLYLIGDIMWILLPGVQ